MLILSEIVTYTSNETSFLNTWLSRSADCIIEAEVYHLQRRPENQVLMCLNSIVDFPITQVV